MPIDKDTVRIFLNDYKDEFTNSQLAAASSQNGAKLSLLQIQNLYRISGPVEYEADCPFNFIHDAKSESGFLYFESESRIFSIDLKHPPTEISRKNAYDRYMDLFRPAKGTTTHQKVM